MSLISVHPVVRYPWRPVKTQWNLKVLLAIPILRPALLKRPGGTLHSFPNLTHELETDRVGHIIWCSCGSCTAMETERECLCCQEYEELGDKMDFISCLTQNASFVTVCLDVKVLRTALLHVWHRPLENPFLTHQFTGTYIGLPKINH